MQKIVYIESLGCAKNLVDSELFLYHIAQNYNYSIAKSPEDSDIILINTCGFIEPAKQDSIEKILEYSCFKDKEIYVIGCLVNRYKEILKKSIPEVKNFLTTSEALKFFVKNENIKEVDFSKRKILTPLSYAYVKISDGCNRNCSYCAIPLIRGHLVVRNKNSIINEISNLCKVGFKEIILVANDLLSYIDENKNDIFKLLEEIEKIDNLYRLRLLYIYPDLKILDIAKFIKNSKKICKYIEIPIQHISSNILSKMKRPSDENFYYKLFDEIRNILPEAVIRSTFIVGFHGETLDDFKKLLNFLKKIKFNWAGFFKYSDEENTEAYKLNNKIPDEEISQRYEEIVEPQKEITEEWLSKRVGSEYEVIIDEILPDEGIILSRGEYEAPEIDGNIILNYNKNLKVNDILKVKLKENFYYDIYAEIV